MYITCVLNMYYWCMDYICNIPKRHTCIIHIKCVLHIHISKYNIKGRKLKDMLM